MNKSELRQLFKKKRKELSDEQLREKSLSIENQIFDRIDFQTVRFVHVFLPIERLREIDTFPIINRLRKEFAEITICVPKMISGESQMEHIAIREDSEFQINEFGISEPIDGEHIEPNKFDVVFVPLLCADKKGNRIGYGKGFYDRFLSECRDDCRKIGLSPFPVIDSIEDVGDFDVPMDDVIIA